MYTMSLGEACEQKLPTVLVVDRQPMVISLARLMLSRLGYQVRAVTSGLEAMKILGHELKFEAVLWDGSLEVGVEEAADLLRRTCPGTRLVLLVESLTSAPPALSPSIGVLKKPFLLHELVNRLSEPRESSLGAPSGS